MQIVPLMAAATLVACGGDSAPPVNPIQGVPLAASGEERIGK